MDGENNGTPYQNGWFGGKNPIFGNTQQPGANHTLPDRQIFGAQGPPLVPMQYFASQRVTQRSRCPGPEIFWRFQIRRNDRKTKQKTVNYKSFAVSLIHFKKHIIISDFFGKDKISTTQVFRIHWYKKCAKLHPWSLTWNLKISPWKRRFLLETIIFRFHVKLGGL